MNSSTTNAPEPVLLILADISGYTRYMTANAKTLAHSQGIITELIHVIVCQIKLPLEVAKLEGDAVFLFCRKTNGHNPWPEAKRIISEKLVTFFRLFSEKLGELSVSNTCSCHACSHIEKLRLKIVVHSGEVLFHRVLNFAELAGVDVIIVHRLLKNSVKGDQYLLLTEAARRDLEFPPEISFTSCSEKYEGLERINTLVYFPEHASGAVASERLSLGRRFSRSWNLYCRLWFAPLTARKEQFRNLPAESGPFARYAYLIAIILLIPIFLPVGAVHALIHSARSNPS